MDALPTHKKNALKAEVSSGLRAVNLVPDTDVRKNRQRARRRTFTYTGVLPASFRTNPVRCFSLDALIYQLQIAVSTTYRCLYAVRVDTAPCDVLGGKPKTHTCTLCESRCIHSPMRAL